MGEKIRKQKKLLALSLVLLLFLSIGFALLEQNLNITGTTIISNGSWSIHFVGNPTDSFSLSTGSVTGTHTYDTNYKSISFNNTLSIPGDFFEFTVDIINDGSVDAMLNAVPTLSIVDNKGTATTSDDSEYTSTDLITSIITYSDGIEPSQYDELKQGDTETIRVRIEFKKDIQNSDLENLPLHLTFNLNPVYVQADSNSKLIGGTPTSFSTDSWSTISRAIKRADTSKYGVGDTKTIDMGSFGIHNVRIANMSTPDECYTEGFSQTACGFVVEFENIIIRHKMNSFNSNFSDYEIGNGNMGGWENSEGRAYVSNNIYNSLPSSLKNIIINTTVVSGHGSKDANNFTTTDKIYLLSEKEVRNTSSYDTAGTYSRQLDYYVKKVEIYGNIASSYAKRYNGVISDWWLRTPSKYNADAFSFQDDRIIENSGTSSAEYGLSPAFRIG